ncbi:phasin family protein [uncultured Massilia sp.]|uniref:phasin family protein n=1 Tax=uncultured Massilia sp. TaxID=169973 RepID=UPI0025FE4C50|nr:phasin family protein [uncultured Massilia sp.]
MYPFPQSMTPAVRTHLDAQTAFFNDMSKSVFKSFQQMCDLNIQLMQGMLEDTALAGQTMLAAERQDELLSAAAARTQPATDRLRAYQQHVSRLAADAQVDLARVAEQHVQQTTRTARAVADEVARSAAPDGERAIRTEPEAPRRAADPFQRAGNGEDHEATRMQAGRAAAVPGDQQAQHNAATH